MLITMSPRLNITKFLQYPSKCLLSFATLFCNGLFNSYLSTELSLSLFAPHSFIPLECAECDDSLLFSGASISVCYIPFAFHPFPPTSFPSSLTSSCHLFLGLPLSLFATKLIYNTFWEFCFLPFSVHAQTNVNYLTLLSLL